MWGWFSLRPKVSTESCHTLSFLSKEQQLDENMVTSPHRPHEVIHMTEGQMEKEAEQEEVRGDRERP